MPRTENAIDAADEVVRLFMWVCAFATVGAFTSTAWAVYGAMRLVKRLRR